MKHEKYITDAAQVDWAKDSYTRFDVAEIVQACLSAGRDKGCVEEKTMGKTYGEKCLNRFDQWAQFGEALRYPPKPEVKA